MIFSSTSRLHPLLLIDITDRKVSWPDASQVLRLYHCEETPNAECIFRLKRVSDKQLTPVVAYHLGDAKGMEKQNTNDDPQFRDRSILEFYNAVEHAMKEFYTDNDTTQSLRNSECFRAIASELTLLADSKSDNRILIVASDIMEKSNLFDSYASQPSDFKVIGRPCGCNMPTCYFHLNALHGVWRKALESGKNKLF
jgi:hypothetical protein